MAMQRRRAGGQQRRGRRNPASYAPGAIRNLAGGGAGRRLNQYGIMDGQAAGPQGMMMPRRPMMGLAAAGGRPNGNGFQQQFPPGMTRGNAWWKQGRDQPGRRMGAPNVQGDRRRGGGGGGRRRQPGGPGGVPTGPVGPGGRPIMPGPGGGGGGGGGGGFTGGGWNEETGQYETPDMQAYNRQMRQAYRRATGMPLDPNFILTRTGAQGQLSGTLAGLSGQRAYLGAQNELGLARLGTDERLQGDLLNEQLAGRGIYDSSIATDDRFNLATQYTRQRQDMANTMLQQYGALGSQANQAWLDYQNTLAQALYRSARDNTNSDAVGKRRRGRR